MQELFSQLFKKDMDDTAGENLLLDISKEYPWFTAAHFFLLKKLSNTNTEYKRIAGRTALLFNNPFLLNYRLKEEKKLKNHQVPQVEKVEEDKQAYEVRAVEIKEHEYPDNSIPEVKAEEQKQPEETTVKKDEVPAPDNQEDQKDEMIFEPLFATDYFASQGIKLSEEVQTGDKLGKQLKSFTEWLKSMKKVHESKLPEGNEQIDQAVQNLAEKSNRDADVLTESMAEAYLQQGKRKKALETLEKLSLLNPAKSAYFAAKIESIAGND